MGAPAISPLARTAPTQRAPAAGQSTAGNPVGSETVSQPLGGSVTEFAEEPCLLHSTLIEQFLRDSTNARTDAYGGSIQNRTRLLREVVEAVIPVFGAECVGVRLSPIFTGFAKGDSNPAATYGHAAEMLGRYGLAYLHVMQVGEGTFDFRELKRRFGGTYIANGGYDAARAESDIRSGAADLVAFGVPFLANPDLVERFKRGDALNEPDRSTFYQGEERGYTDYPSRVDASAL